MKLAVTGMGIWTQGIYSSDAFLKVLQTRDAELGEWRSPSPESIPARERRRAPLTVRLAVEVAHQACSNAGCDPETIATVFSSVMGDSEITDYMCRTLAGENKILSPTRFHNSVHNAPAGYWSISTQNRAPSSSVAANQQSFAVALLEAATLAASEQRPVLLINSDIADKPPIADAMPIAQTFAAALVLEPNPGDSAAPQIEIHYERGKLEATAAPTHPALRALANANPMALCLPLLEQCYGGGTASLSWPINNNSMLQVDTL
ncbi:MAG: beta-ketoacyl synthase chain length factor [Gammaproteobacteria bacterium]